MAKVLENIGRMITLLSKKPASLHAIMCTTKLHRRTVRRYLELIETIQAAPRLKKDIQGARVVFRMDS